MTTDIPYDIMVGVARVCSDWQKGGEISTYNTTWSEQDSDPRNTFCKSPMFSEELIAELSRPVLPFLVTGLTGLTISLLGLVGNSLSIIVLNSRIYTPSTYSYLIALAIADSLFLVFTSMLSLNDVLHTTLPNSHTFNVYKEHTFPYINPLSKTFHTISIWLTVAFTADRYIMICHPFFGVRYCSRRRATIVSLALYAAAFIYNIPNFLEHKVKIYPFQGTRFAKAEMTTFGGSKLYVQAYDLALYSVFLLVIPIVALAVLNVKLALTVKQAKLDERRISLGKSYKHRTDTTIMLIAVVFVFFICQTPAFVYHVMWASIGRYLVADSSSNTCNAYCFTREISNLLVILNSSVNILIYYGFSQKFRREFAGAVKHHCVTNPKLFISKCVNYGAAPQKPGYDVCSQRDVELDGNNNQNNVSNKVSTDESTEESDGKSHHRPLARQSMVSFTTALSAEGTVLFGPKAPSTLLVCDRVAVV